jgi:hypothetical protein
MTGKTERKCLNGNVILGESFSQITQISAELATSGNQRDPRRKIILR